MHWGKGQLLFSRCVSYEPGRKTRTLPLSLPGAYQSRRSPSKPDRVRARTRKAHGEIPNTFAKLRDTIPLEKFLFLRTNRKD